MTSTASFLESKPYLIETYLQTLELIWFLICFFSLFWPSPSLCGTPHTSRTSTHKYTPAPAKQRNLSRIRKSIRFNFSIFRNSLKILRLLFFFLSPFHFDSRWSSPYYPSCSQALRSHKQYFSDSPFPHTNRSNEISKTIEINRQIAYNLFSHLALQRIPTCPRC